MARAYLKYNRQFTSDEPYTRPMATIKMDLNLIVEYRKKIVAERCLSAYHLRVATSLEHGKTNKMILLSKELSASLRGKAYVLSTQKADEEAIEIESLLKRTIKINGHGIRQ